MQGGSSNQNEKNMGALVETLPKIPQWESIPYAGDLACPCGKSGFASFQESPKMIGWCETPEGYQVVLECPVCCEKYRFHGSHLKYDLPALEYGMRCFMGYCSNNVELRKIVFPDK